MLTESSWARPGSQLILRSFGRNGCSLALNGHGCRRLRASGGGARVQFPPGGHAAALGARQRRWVADHAGGPARGRAPREPAHQADLLAITALAARALILARYGLLPRNQPCIPGSRVKPRPSSVAGHALGLLARTRTSVCCRQISVKCGRKLLLAPGSGAFATHHGVSPGGRILTDHRDWISACLRMSGGPYRRRSPAHGAMVALR